MRRGNPVNELKSNFTTRWKYLSSPLSPRPHSAKCDSRSHYCCNHGNQHYLNWSVWKTSLEDGQITQKHGKVQRDTHSQKNYATAKILSSKSLKLQIQFSSVAQSCPTLCNPMNRSTPGLPVHHQLPELTQTHVHRVSDAIQPSHPLSSPLPLPPISPSISLFQWVNSSHEVAKVHL